MPPRSRVILEEASQISPALHVRVTSARFLTAALASQEMMHAWVCRIAFKGRHVAYRANNPFYILAGVCQQRLDNPVMYAKYIHGASGLEESIKELVHLLVV